MKSLSTGITTKIINGRVEIRSEKLNEKPFQIPLKKKIQLKIQKYFKYEN